MAKREALKDPRGIGGRYWNGYWGKAYRVLALGVENGTPWWRVQWEDDGRISVHATPWERRLGDRVLEVGELV